MADDIKITYRMTPQEVVGAVRARSLHSMGFRLLGALFIVVVLLFILQAVISGISLLDLVAELVPMVIVIILFGLITYANPLLAWRIRRDPKILSEQTWEFSDAGVRLRSEHGDATNAWSAFPRVGEDRQFFYLYPSASQNMFHPIPKRALFTVADESRLRDLLKQKIAKWV